MSTQRFKEIISSGNLKKLREFLDNEQSWVIISEDPEILQYPLALEGKCNIEIFTEIFSRLRNSKKDKIINRPSKSGDLTLFLALDAGKDYFDACKDYENVNWSVFDKNGSSLLHYALSLENVAEESLNFLYKKLGGNECLFKINDDSENALHCVVNLKNFKWCLEKCESSNPNKIRSLLHSVNNIGETPVVKLLKNEDLQNDKASLEGIINTLKDKKYDFLKSDNNEQNAISYLVAQSPTTQDHTAQNDYNILLGPFLSDDAYEEERIEIAFSAIEYGKDDLLESLWINDKGNFILKNCDKLIEKYPKRLANFVKNNQSILSDSIKLPEANYDIDDKQFSKVVHLSVKCANYDLADQCFKHLESCISNKAFKNEGSLKKYSQASVNKSVDLKQLQLLQKETQITDKQLERLRNIEKAHLDYAYKNNPEMFAELVQRSFKFKSEVSLKSSVNQEPNQVNQKVDNSLLYKFLCSASVDDIKKYFDSLDDEKGNDIIKSKDLSKAAFAAARDGDLFKLEFFVNCNNGLIYQEDISGKNLLEVAAENSHSKIVQYIICKHKEIHKGQNGKTADEVPLDFVNDINNRKDPWAKDLARELKRILHKKDFNESDGSKIDGILSSHIDNKQQEKEVKNFNTDNYDNLSFYADVIKSGNRKKFETALKDIDPKRNLHSLLNSNGHNLITLTAALGTPDCWEEIEKAYVKVEGRSAISASLDKMSSIGSPIQSAIIANNLPMYNHFLDSKNGFIVNKRYGTGKNNVLHTILQSNKVELLNDILFKFKNDKESLAKALLQVNKDNKNPLDLALEKSHYGFFEKALDVIANCNKDTIGSSLIADDCRLIKSAVSLGNKRAVERVLSLQDEYNKGVKDKKNDQLDLLNYKNSYSEGGGLEKSELLNLACEHSNVQTANYILELLKKENKASNKVLVNALTASISKDSDNKEIFDLLFSQEFETIRGGVTTPIHKAAECGNVHALKYLIDKFPKILNIQDKDGKTPLHLAISNGNRKAIEFLVENGADFDKPDNKGITSFELALGDNRFADICIDLLRYNPKATIPIYRAISSGNKGLIGKLIDQNHWVLDQCSLDTLNPNVLGGETALRLALRSGINKDLTKEIANKSIENFKKLGKGLQEALLKQGFLNDIIKSDIYTLYPIGTKRAGEVTAFIKSEIEKDSSLLFVTGQGTTLLYDVVSSNNEELFGNIENYIRRDAITKKSSKLEETTFHAAVKSGNSYIVEALLKKVGNQEDEKSIINKYNAEGYTSLQIAAKSGNKEIYDLFKERGGDLKSKTKDGDSMAHLLVLSAMKDPTDNSYEYKKLLKDHPELTKHVNNAGDGLLAAAAKCTNQDEASKIMTQLLDNEFKHKKGQFTEEDAVRLLSNAISSNNFDVVQEVVFNNMKGKVVNKIADVIAGDDTDKTFKAKVRRTVAHAIAPNSQEHIHNINKTKVLSQSIKESLSSNEERKQSLSQKLLNFLHIKAQKGSSNKVDINTLFDFLVEDQSSHANSKDDLFLIKEEVKVSSVRKRIIEQQERLNQKFNNFFKQKLEYTSWEEEADTLYQKHTELLDNISELEIKRVICEVINEFGIAEDTKIKAYQSCFGSHTTEEEKENGQIIWNRIESAFQNKELFDVQEYGKALKTLRQDERQNYILSTEKKLQSLHREQSLDKDKCYKQICTLDNKIEDYEHNSNDLHRLKISQDVFYTNCKSLEGKSIADRVFTSNESSLIKGVILENEDLWDPRFVDSEGNTLLHKLAGMVEEDDRLIDYIQPLINKGFSLTRKNSEGKSAEDIFIEGKISIPIEITEAEKQIHGLFEKKLNSLLESGSADDLAKAIHNNEQGCKKYYGTIFNPFHSVVSSCFNGDLSNSCLFDKKADCFKELLKSNDLRSALDRTDEKRCSFLHRAIEEAAANYSGSDTNKMLERILLDVASGLNSSRNSELCNDLFFKQRNSNGDNVIEALSKVPDSLNIFKRLEKKLSKNAFADECDLNLILVNAAGSKNSDLFEHVIEEYALNRFRAPNLDGQPPLHAAVMSGDQKTVLAVLKSSANINQTNSNGRTALHELLIFLRDNPDSQEHIGLVNYLVSHGAFFGPYQEEERNKEGDEISEVIESVDEDIKEKILFSIARGRSSFYDLKHSLLSETENFIKLKNKPLVLDLDVAGSVVFTKITNGTFKSSKFLNSNVCKLNHLTTSYFDIDGCKGYVQKSIGGKRNYVIFEDGISEGNSGKHPTKIKVWLSNTRSITVLVSADGTIEPAETSHKIMGVEVKDSLLKYKDRKEEFKKDYSKYKGYIEELWGKIDSQDEYKNEVYIGGIPLKKALMKGRWYDENMQKQKQTQKSQVQQGVQKSPGNNAPNHSRRNSGGDEIGETLADAQIGQSDVGQATDQLQPESNNIIAADGTSHEEPATEAVYSEQEESTRLGVKNQKNNQSISRLSMNDNSKNLDELEQRFNQKNYGLKSVPSQKQHSDSDKLMSELEKRFAQQDKGLKRTPPQKQHDNSDGFINSELGKRFNQENYGLKSVSSQKQHSNSNELMSELGQRLTMLKMGLKEVDPSKINPELLRRLVSDGLLIGEDEKRKNFYEGVNQATKEIAEGLKDIAKKSSQALTLSSQEVKNAQPQQVKTLNDEKKKNFYKDINQVVKEIAEGLKDIVEKSSQASNKKMMLNLGINPNNDINVSTPDSGYGSDAGSPIQEEKGMMDSRESEKSKTSVKHCQSPSEKYIIEDNGIELGDIEFEMEEKGIEDSCKSEKQKNADNRLSSKPKVCNEAKLIMVEEHKPELNKIQVIKRNLTPVQNTQNHMGPRAKAKFLDTYHRNGLNLKIGDKSPLPPIPSSGNNKSGRCR